MCMVMIATHPGVQGRDLEGLGDSLKQLAENATSAITKPVEGVIGTVKNTTTTAVDAVTGTAKNATVAVKNTTVVVLNTTGNAAETLANATKPKSGAGVLTFSSAAFGILMLAQFLLV